MNKTIYLAGGCFWGLQKYLDQFDGIKKTTVGYANGNTENPTYEEVCAGSGHAETVLVEYDLEKIGLTEVLEKYFAVIDPTSVNRQGNDIGVQYRTGIYYVEDADVEEIKAAVSKLEDSIGKEVAIEVIPLQSFYPAEEYHQKYLDKNPGGYCHIPRHMLGM